jgi:short chain dehydrogenase
MSDAQKPFGNKLVVVTGAGSGIGRATALGFAANGARIVTADLDLAAAESVSELIAARGGTAHARQADVSAAADMERFASWVRAEVGVPDVVVNNGEGCPCRPARGAARSAGGPGERRGQGHLCAVQARSGGVARAGQAGGRAVAGPERPGRPMTPRTRPRHGILEVVGVLQVL